MVKFEYILYGFATICLFVGMFYFSIFLADAISNMHQDQNKVFDCVEKYKEEPCKLTTCIDQYDVAENSATSEYRVKCMEYLFKIGG